MHSRPEQKRDTVALPCLYGDTGTRAAGGATIDGGDTMASIPANAVPTTNKHLIRWVEKTAELCQPARIHWLDGSAEENTRLCEELVEAGTFQRLDPVKWPGCFYARSSPNDVARVEDRTFICSLSKRRRRSHQQLGRPLRDAQEAEGLFRGCMRGRTMYVMPFSMGPIGSPMSQIGVQLTDSAYAVVNMRIMARIGAPVFAEIDKDVKRVVPCVHTVGAPLADGQQDVPWPQNDDQVHRAFSGDARDLELRLGLRRQRAAGQEVFCAAHRFEHRPR